MTRRSHFLYPQWARPSEWVPRHRPHPAAGVLPVYVDADGAWVLLGLRTTCLGGTWSNFGGSLEPGEAPLTAALREFHEEVGVTAAAAFDGATLGPVIDSSSPDVPYTLFVLDTPVCYQGDVDLSWEHDDVSWFHATDVPTLNLHAGFARAWALLTRRPEGIPA